MRKWLAAIAIAVLLSMAWDVVVPDVCAALTPEENWFLWWWNGCDKGSVGGGGSGAG